MPFGTFISIFSFLKELVFGNNKNQKNSIPSKLRKWIILLILIASLFINYQAITRLIVVTQKYIVLQKENKVYKEKLNAAQQCEASLNILKTWLKQCITP